MSKGVPLFIDAPDLEGVLRNVLVASIRTQDEFTHKIIKWMNQQLEDRGSSFRVDNYTRVSNSRAYGNAEFCPTLYSEFKNKEQPGMIREKVAGKSFYIVATSDLLLDSIGQIATPQEIVMRSCIVARAAKASGAGKVILVMPLEPYARQDPQVPVVEEKYAGQADTLNFLVQTYKLAGVDELMTFHPHSKRLSEYCQRAGLGLSVLPHVPVYAHYILFNSKWQIGESGSNTVFEAPDEGAWSDVDEMLRLPQFSRASGLYFKKIRKSPNDPNKVIMHVDHTSQNFTTLEGKILVSIDDLMDTCGTQRVAGDTTNAEGILHNGVRSRPKEIAIIASHPVFSGQHYRDPQQRLNFPGVKEVVFANTVPTFERTQTTELKEVSAVIRLASYVLNAIIAREQGMDLREAFSTERMLANPSGYGHLYDIVRSSLKSA